MASERTDIELFEFDDSQVSEGECSIDDVMFVNRPSADVDEHSAGQAELPVYLSLLQQLLSHRARQRTSFLRKK